MILGIDCGTRYVGYSIMDDEELIKYDMIDLSNIKTGLVDKALRVREIFQDIFLYYRIHKVAIEEPLMFMSSGNSRAKILIQLASFNTLIQFIVKDTFGFDVESINVSTARKLNGLKIKRGIDTKKQVLDFVIDKYDTFSVEFTKHGNPRVGYTDMADSIIIGNAARLS